MKDIDFDELDKAVNSLMGTVAKEDDTPKAKTLSISTTLKGDEDPAYNKIEEAAQRIGSETIGVPLENTAVLPSHNEKDDIKSLDLTAVMEQEAKKASAEVQPVAPVSEPAQQPAATSTETPQIQTRPRSGRFMDVMHSSSDMKSSATPAAAEVPVKPRPSREAATILPPKSVGTPTPAPAPAPTPIVSTPEPTPTPAAVPIVEPVPEPKQPEPAPVPAATPEPEPLTTPFIPDAKVEKRPLGGGQAALADDENIDGMVDRLGASAKERERDTQLTPMADEGNLPAELDNNLLAIETGIATEIDEPADSANNMATGTATDTPENGAIYDVTSYHKQPEHLDHSTSSWVWVLIIVAVVVICGAGAAAFYLLSAK